MLWKVFLFGGIFLPSLVDLSDLFVDLSVIYVDLSENYHHNQSDKST